MKRRDLIKGMGLAAVATSINPMMLGATEKSDKRKNCPHNRYPYTS